LYISIRIKVYNFTTGDSRMEDANDFVVVQRKGRHAPPVEVSQEYRILTEDEIRDQRNRLKCRRGTTDSMGDLFRVDRERPAFPKVFENYRLHTHQKKETPFTTIKQRNIVRSKIECVDCSGTVQ